MSAKRVQLCLTAATHHAAKLAPYGNKIASPPTCQHPPPPPPKPWIIGEGDTMLTLIEYCS